MAVDPTETRHSASRRRFRPGLVAAGVGLAALLAGGLAVLRSGRGKADPVDPQRDVPRLDGDAITFSTAFRDRAGITFAAAERASLQPTLRLVGTVTFNPSHVAAVGTRVRGTVRRTFRYEGDSVKVGDPLAEIESAELGEAQSAIAQAQAAQAAAELQARREKDLLEKALTTAREAEVARAEYATATARLRAAQQRVKALGGSGPFGVYVLRSPIAGHVVEVHLSPGQSVDDNVIGYEVADLDHLWVELSVFERDLDSVQIGDAVEVAPLAEPEQRIAGRVAHVGEVIEASTRSTGVRVDVDHPKYHLRVGQAVSATVRRRQPQRDALLIPRDAVVSVDGKPTVFVALDDHGKMVRVRPVSIQLGASDGSRQEVVEGLSAGQPVASAGVFALKSELFR
jgi:cobalt-zinc-cadmium efflux system membrane fusion protein